MTPIEGADGLAVELDISDLECKTENAIEMVNCTNWEVMCAPGESFFFRLATFGEVYELATKVVEVDGETGVEEITWRKATNGVIPCEDITVND